MVKASLQIRLAQAIRAQREKLGVSQEAFADKIHVHRTYYGAIERGRQNLTVRSIEKIAAGLEVSPAQLFFDADNNAL